MEHHRQYRLRLSYVQDMIVDSEDILKIAMLVFTIFSFLQEKYILIWLPISITTWACVHLQIFIQTTYEIFINPRQYICRKRILLLRLIIFFLGFSMLQKLRMNIPALEKRNEEIVVLIYMIYWFLIGSYLNVIGNRCWLAVILLFSWLSATVGLVFILSCFEGFLKGKVCEKFGMTMISKDFLTNY